LPPFSQRKAKEANRARCDSPAAGTVLTGGSRGRVAHRLGARWGLYYSFRFAPLRAWGDYVTSCRFPRFGPVTLGAPVGGCVPRPPGRRILYRIIVTRPRPGKPARCQTVPSGPCHLAGRRRPRSQSRTQARCAAPRRAPEIVFFSFPNSVWERPSP